MNVSGGGSRISLVLVDFDDTLVDTGPRFQNARRSLLTLMQEAGFETETVRAVLFDVIDPDMRVKYGLGPKRMEPAFVATYLHLCELHGTTVVDEVMRRAAELGRGCYGAGPLFEGALDALRRLAHAHSTVIYTQSGDLEYQLSCVRDAGIGEIIAEEHIRICERKDVGMFSGALQSYGVTNPTEAWMIGNSMRSDINPALEAGANAILVETEDPWEHDVVEPHSSSFHRVRTFPDAVGLLVP
ncbi:MAG: HAD family hydrolase [Gemmatimonadota bacterium]